MVTKPCRLEMNNSGSWKLLGTFDLADEDSADDILNAAAALADALNERESGRRAMCTLRVSTDEPHPEVLARYESPQCKRGWRKPNGEPA